MVNLILFEPEEIGKPLPKRDERAVHLIKVLRKGVGDTFDAGVAGGLLGTGRITERAPDGSLRFELTLSRAGPPRFPLRIAVGFPRPIQLRRLLRDLSNLGVSAIDLLGTDLGEKSYRDTTLLTDGGARAALTEGAVQARDTSLPGLNLFPSLDAWLAAAPWGLTPMAWGQTPSHPILIAPDNVDPRGSFAKLDPIGLELAGRNPDSAGLDSPGIDSTRLDGGRASLVLAVGSERGWSGRERAILDQAGFLRLAMGDRALRTETACVAAAVLGLEKIGALG
jgi:16S rRNA (uracil1498-N3)-methyltransferase